MVDESVLFENLTQQVKRVGVLPVNTPPEQRTNMVYKGTRVINGEGVIIVTATGLSTLLGKRLITSYLKNMKRNIIKKYVLGFKGKH